MAMHRMVGIRNFYVLMKLIAGELTALFGIWICKLIDIHLDCPKWLQEERGQRRRCKQKNLSVSKTLFDTIYTVGCKEHFCTLYIGSKLDKICIIDAQIIFFAPTVS